MPISEWKVFKTTGLSHTSRTTKRSRSRDQQLSHGHEG